MPIVAMPDGTQVQFPEDMPKEQIRGMIASKFPDLGQQQSQQPSFLDRVKQDYQNRVDNAQKFANAGVSGEKPMWQAIPEMGRELVTAPISDVTGEALKSFYDTTAAPQVKRGFSQIGNYIANSPVGTAINSVSNKYGKLEKQYPNATDAINSIAGFAGDVGNIAGIRKVGNLLSSTVGGLSKEAGNALVKSGNSALSSNKMKFAQDLVSPLNDTKTARIAAVENMDVSGPFQTAKPIPTRQEMESAANVADIVSPRNTMQKNYNLVHNAIGKEAKKLKSALDRSNVSFVVSDPYAGNQNVFKPVLQNAIEELNKNTTLVGDSKKIAIGLVNKMNEFVDANPATPSGLLEARKQFDKFVQAGKPKIFDQNIENGISAANSVIRNTTNDFISQAVPDAAVKASLARQSSMYRALDNIAPKAAKEASTAISRFGQKLDKAIPIKNAVTRHIIEGSGLIGLAGAGAIAPVGTAATIGVGGGLYGLGKLAAAPTTRKAIGNALKASGLALDYGTKQSLMAMKPSDALLFINQLKSRQKNNSGVK